MNASGDQGRKGGGGVGWRQGGGKEGKKATINSLTPTHSFGENDVPKRHWLYMIEVRPHHRGVKPKDFILSGAFCIRKKSKGSVSIPLPEGECTYAEAQ